MEHLRRLENECENEYIARMYKNKTEYGLTNKEVCEMLNLELGYNKAESTYRSVAYPYIEGFDNGYEKALKEFKPEKKDNNENKSIELDIENKYKNTIELNKDGSQTSDKLLRMSEEDCKDVDFLLKAHGYDINKWELVSARNNIWNAYSKKDGIMTLYSSKITVKPLEEYRWNKEDIVKIFDNLKIDYKNKKYIEPKQFSKNGKILVVPIADFHFGLVSDNFSNGNDYNLEIAEELFFQVINDVIENNKDKQFEKVLFVAGNDTTNSDNLSSTTAKGTPQNDCALWFTIVERITNILIQGIDILSEIAPVDVVYVPSNHDLHTMFGVMQTISAWYKNDKNVSVDTSPLPRKYYKFGKNILAFSHDVKVKEALKIVSTEAKDMWTDSNRVIFMLAHLHQAMMYEKQGMLEILRLPTISGYSRWTNTQGYVQTERKNQAFVIDYKYGIKETQNTVLDL